MKGLRGWLWLAALVLIVPCLAFAEPAPPEPIAPDYPIREDVGLLLNIARQELGYAEQGGKTKYGEWAGDPSAEWCAEFLCWAVDQADQSLESPMLNVLYPNYGANNTGRDWFIRQGRYIARKGIVPDWGTQWYKGSETSMERNSYVPQPGDWVFFSYNATGDTSHVAMVEQCLRLPDGSILVQVIEGNNPSAVARAQYPLTDWRIQGYGTVRDLADMVLRMGAQGAKVSALQAKLRDIGLLQEGDVTGLYNQRTSDALKVFQHQENLRPNGIANQQTQLLLEAYHARYRQEHVHFWIVD